MIEEKISFVAACDRCHRHENWSSGYATVDAAMASALRAGWRMVKDKGTGRLLCAACQDVEAKHP